MKRTSTQKEKWKAVIQNTQKASNWSVMDFLEQHFDFNDDSDDEHLIHTDSDEILWMITRPMAARGRKFSGSFSRTRKLQEESVRNNYHGIARKSERSCAASWAQRNFGQKIQQ